jgi:thiosulfate/3-mercaptopyruvate sulfurtransferase
MMTTLLLAVYLPAVEPAYAAPNMLVEVTEAKLKEYRVIDVRAKEKYAKGHVPGAVHADLAKWSKAVLAEEGAALWPVEFAKLGMTPKQPVVVYGDDPKETARAWWILKYAGVPDARILNGGWKAWTVAKLPTEETEPAVTASVHKWERDAARLADKAHVLKMLKEGGGACVDARTPDEFSGEKALAKKGGRIPGATHLEWVELLDPKTDKFLAPAELKKLIAERKIDLDKPQVTYCQGGGRAAVVAFGLELAGAKSVRNYYPSWGEWGNATDTPIEKK